MNNTLARCLDGTFDDLDRFRDLCATVEGLSSPRCLAVINAAVSDIPDCVYCEIGAYKGLSARAAMLGNEGKEFHIVESFREVGIYGDYRETLLRNLDNGRGDNLTLHEIDGFQFLKHHAGKPFDVFYYDGEHSSQSTYYALSLARYHLKPGSIVFLDDTNGGLVRDGMMHAIHDFPFNLLRDWWSPKNGYTDGFWNGFAVLQYGG